MRLEKQGDMEYCLAAAALNGVDRRSLQRSARLGREVLERAKRRAVDWRSPERSRCSVGVLYRQGPYQERWSVPGPQRLLGEKYYSSVPEEGGATHVSRYHRRQPPEVHVHSDLGHGQEQRSGRVETSIGPGSSYQTSEHSREVSWPCTCPEPPSSQVWSLAGGWSVLSAALNTVRHLQLSELCNMKGPIFQAEDISKDLYIEVYPGTYSVTVGSSPLTKKTHVVAVDSGQSVDLVFPV